MKIWFRPKIYIARNLRNHYWIDDTIVRPSVVKADSIKEAFITFVDAASETGVTITKSGLRNKQPMFVDNPDGSSKQIGYVINAWTEIEGKRIPLEIWLHMKEVRDLNFEEA